MNIRTHRTALAAATVLVTAGTVLTTIATSAHADDASVAGLACGLTADNVDGSDRTRFRGDFSLGPMFARDAIDDASPGPSEGGVITAVECWVQLDGATPDRARAVSAAGTVGLVALHPNAPAQYRAAPTHDVHVCTRVTVAGVSSQVVYSPRCPAVEIVSSNQVGGLARTAHVLAQAPFLVVE